ncbi:amidase family protein [Kribbella solani]|uniref:amidase family protein n=1 Tax=Kribbella solani TaxID=236067 RepID=UPI0029B32609|nr:amidase family protein [Kribbella solani]MDX2973432.1 amidase family protein [Kribbella solani]MDX3000846.1 amidase family protein [Kribbella solani]
MIGKPVGLAEFLRVFDRVEELGQPAVELRYPRRGPGRRPRGAEDPYHAITRWCEVLGAAEGPLAGLRVGVKDNIAVAGVPMTEGLAPALSTVPSGDAAVVERLLDAGARITAKTSISPSDPAFGIPRNPHDPRFSAGASSAGSAVAVVTGLVDAAIGVDQGGSVRNPAAYCGIVGMKPTHGLVPTYGLAYWDHTLDHIGPMTTTVAANAALLEVLAGADWRDPHCTWTAPVRARYTGTPGEGIADLRIGVVEEALDPVGCTAGTLEAFERACERLRDLGAKVEPVSIPLWSDSAVIWFAVLTSGLMAMAGSNGQGYGHLGRIDVDRLATVAGQYRRGEREVPWLASILPAAYEYIQETRLGVPFGKAQNLRLELRRQVEHRLDEVDLLITPTTPTGPELLDELGSDEFVLADYVRAMTNTTPANLTGHPALTVPSGPGDNELPTGLQIIGRMFDERTVYRAGLSFEDPQFS